MELYHSIIGLPRSGKTTFLAALWHLIDAAEIETRLVLEKLEGDKRYLNQIATAWRDCKPVLRTSQNGEISVNIHARFVDSDTSIVLGFPDLSGESFERQFAIRQVKPDYLDGFNKTGGILVFVSANKTTDGIMISDLGPDILDGDADAAVSPTPPEPMISWKHEMVPQQAQLVDLLQMLQRPPFEIRRRKLSLIVSAWDVISDPDLSPSEWVAREVPLLDQFLKHNPDSFEIKVWGISAQGGDIRGEKRSQLLAMTPSERVRCVGDEGSSHDLTVPISWLSEAF